MMKTLTPILIKPSSLKELNLLENLLQKMQIDYKIQKEEISSFHKQILEERMQFLEENPNALVKLDDAKQKIKEKYGI